MPAVIPTYILNEKAPHISAMQNAGSQRDEMLFINIIFPTTENVKNNQQENPSNTDNLNPIESKIIRFSIGTPYIDRYIEKQYNNFRLVSVNNFL